MINNNKKIRQRTGWLIGKNLLLAAMVTTAVGLNGCGSDSDAGSDNNIQEADDSFLPKVEGSNFTLAVLPDTQKYSQYSPERYFTQTQWIADNYKKQKIKFTVHLGDVVEKTWTKDANGNFVTNTAEWEVAKKAMGVLEANPETPFSILAGNHDVILQGDNDRFDDSLTDIHRVANNQNFVMNDVVTPLPSPAFLTYFPVTEQQQHFSTFKGSDPTGFNSYHIFSDDDGQQYMVMALDWRPSDETITWANEVLKQHANIPTILTTHQLMNIDTDGKSAIFTENGARLWDKLIKDNDQVFLTINGHHHGEAIKTAKNSFGRTVYLMVVDYQSGFWGGNSMMQLIEFDKSHNELDFLSFSPWVANLPKDKRQPQDELSRWKFSVPLDYKTRFSHLNKPTCTDEAGNVKDTVAYWIFDKDHQVTSSDGKVVFPDLSGHGNNMTLKAFPENTKPLSDVFSVVDDAPNFGYAKGAAKFETGAERDKDGAFLLTKGSIPEDGKLETFTLEAVVKVSPKWTPEANRWSGIFAQIPGEKDVCAHHKGLSCGSSGSAGGLFISSLAEIQYYGVAGNSNSSSNWSWELNKDYWYHIAVVNDGTYNTMYVDGSQVMRTREQEQPGWYTLPNSEWAVGVGSDDNMYHSLFRGEVAEVRLTERALDRSEWLYSKVK